MPKKKKSELNMPKNFKSLHKEQNKFTNKMNLLPNAPIIIIFFASTK